MTQVLTALELARQARIAANRAYLAGLQKGPDAMSKGEVQPLQVADPAVLAAARQLATSAALCQAKNQVGQPALPACMSWNSLKILLNKSLVATPVSILPQAAFLRLTCLSRQAFHIKGVTNWRGLQLEALNW